MSAFGRSGHAGADSRVSPAVRGLDLLARQYSAIGIEVASIERSTMRAWGGKRILEQRRCVLFSWTTPQARAWRRGGFAAVG